MTTRLRLALVDRYIAWRLGRRRREGPARGVLLLCSGGIGDALLFALVAARFARLARAGEPVDVLVREDTRAITFLYPPGIGVRAVDYGRFLGDSRYRATTCLDLHDRGYRLAVSCDHLRHPLIDDALVRAAGADEALAMEPRSWPKYDRLLARNRRHYSRLVAVSPGMAHRLVRWVDFANALAGADDPVPVVRLPPERLPAPARLDAPTVVLHPFSAIRERQHAAAVFVRILAMVPADWRAVLSAGPGDLDRAPEFRVLLADGRVALDEGGFEAKAGLLRAARLVVAVDTSLMHLAVAVGAPTVCLASAAHVVDSVPYDPRMMPANVAFLYHDMPCAGCLGTCVLPPEDGRYPCVARLDEGRIAAAVARVLAAPAQPRA